MILSDCILGEEGTQLLRGFLSWANVKQPGVWKAAEAKGRILMAREPGALW